MEINIEVNPRGWEILIKKLCEPALFKNLLK